MAGKTQNGALSQPKTFGATLESPKIISDSARPTDPNTRTFLASLIARYYAPPKGKEASELGYSECYPDLTPVRM